MKHIFLVLKRKIRSLVTPNFFNKYQFGTNTAVYVVIAYTLLVLKTFIEYIRFKQCHYQEKVREDV